MNYYEHHLGDYAKDARHLSILEDGVYRRLLDRYYSTEQPIPHGQAYRLVGARTNDEQEAVDVVLSEFFQDTPEGFRHHRCDAEIAKFRDKQDKAKASANARWSSAKPSESERNANAMRTHSEGNAHQSPVTSNQSKAEAKARARPAPLDLPDWLPADVWADWHDYRNARKGWTAKAKTLSLKTLSDLWEAGHDPRAVINQAIERGWTGLFPLRSDPRAGPSSQPSKHLQGVANILGVNAHDLTENRPTALVRASDRAVLGGPVSAEPRRLPGSR